MREILAKHDYPQTLKPYVSLGKTALASLVVSRLNQIHNEQAPGCMHTPVAAFIPMDGYHLSRAQLSNMSDPSHAHARRGAAFTFDSLSFLKLVEGLRQPLAPETKTLYAPSFDHAVKDPVPGNISVPPTARIVIFEGNYLSLNRGEWKTAAELMDELWFIEVEFKIARRRLLARHIKAGLAKDEEEAGRRADENDLPNGREIIAGRMEVQELITSEEDDTWAP